MEMEDTGRGALLAGLGGCGFVCGLEGVIREEAIAIRNLMFRALPPALTGTLLLVTPLAGALDLAAAFSCCPNPISTCWLFAETRSSFAVDFEQRSLSDWPPFLVKLDVWELVRPRKNNTWPFLTSKAQRGGSRGLAVRQAALLTYELLGGEKKKEGQVKRWFKPVSELISDAANGILYVGLQGSPLFETSESFFHKLEAAIQSGEGGPRALHAPASQTREHSVALHRSHRVA
jgi:hypothetical protein